MFYDRIADLVREGLSKGIRVNQLTDAVEKQYIVDVLISCRFNQCKAADILGWHRNTLGRKLQDHRVNVEQLKAQARERKPAASQAAQTHQTRFA